MAYGPAAEVGRHPVGFTVASSQKCLQEGSPCPSGPREKVPQVMSIHTSPVPSASQGNFTFFPRLQVRSMLYQVGNKSPCCWGCARAGPLWAAGATANDYSPSSHFSCPQPRSKLLICCTLCWLHICMATAASLCAAGWGSGGGHIFYFTYSQKTNLNFQSISMWCCVQEAVPFISASAVNCPGLRLESGKLLGLIAVSCSDLQSLSGRFFDLTKLCASTARILPQPLGGNPADRLQA